MAIAPHGPGLAMTSGLMTATPSSNVSKPVGADKRAMNDVAEFLAAAEAVKMTRASGINKLLINTDSNFMIQYMNEWVPNWKLCGWKMSKGTNVKNKDELLKLEAAIRGEEDQEPIKIVWNRVRGHKGLKGNECADKLAMQRRVEKPKLFKTSNVNVRLI